MEVNSNHSEKEISKKFAEVMARKIVEWDIEMIGPDNVMVPMPITGANILRLKPPLWIRIINIVVWGQDGGDMDPKAKIAEIKSQVDADYEAILNGGKVGDVRLESERKN